MLNVNSVIGGAALMFLGWIAMTVVELKTDTAVIAVKVDENHRMLSVLWNDFLENKDDNFAWFDESTGFKATTKAKEEQGS